MERAAYLHLQRAAIARAGHEPPVLPAVGTTGKLETASAQQMVALLQKIASQRRTTMVGVTHSEDVAWLTHRQVHLRDGQIVAPIS